MARFVTWLETLSAKTTTIDGTEKLHIDSSGLSQQATLLDLVRYVLANGFSATDLSILNRNYIKAATRTLTENTPTALVDVAVSANTVASGILSYSIQANDAAGDYQNLLGEVNYSVCNKAGVLSTNLTEVRLANTETAGTLTCATTLVPGTNKVIISCNAISSLTQTTLRSKWSLSHDGYATITANTA